MHTYIGTYIHTNIHTYQVKMADDAADPSLWYIQLHSLIWIH